MPTAFLEQAKTVLDLLHSLRQQKQQEEKQLAALTELQRDYNTAEYRYQVNCQRGTEWLTPLFRTFQQDRTIAVSPVYAELQRRYSETSRELFLIEEQALSFLHHQQSTLENAHTQLQEHRKARKAEERELAGRYRQALADLAGNQEQLKELYAYSQSLGERDGERDGDVSLLVHRALCTRYARERGEAQVLFQLEEPIPGRVVRRTLNSILNHYAADRGKTAEERAYDIVCLYEQEQENGLRVVQMTTATLVLLAPSEVLYQEIATGETATDRTVAPLSSDTSFYTQEILSEKWATATLVKKMVYYVDPPKGATGKPSSPISPPTTIDQLSEESFLLLFRNMLEAQCQLHRLEGLVDYYSQFEPERHSDD